MSSALAPPEADRPTYGTRGVARSEVLFQTVRYGDTLTVTHASVDVVPDLRLKPPTIHIDAYSMHRRSTQGHPISRHASARR